MKKSARVSEKLVSPLTGLTGSYAPDVITCGVVSRGGSRGGEMGEFSAPFSETPSFFFPYLSNIKIIYIFSDAFISVT